MKVVDFLRADSVIASLASTSKSAILAEMAAHLAARVSGVDAAALTTILEERETLASTGIGDGIAIPHGKLDAVGQLVGLLARAPAGVDFESIDAQPTQLIFMLVAPSSSTRVHLKALARLSRLFRDPAFRLRLIAAADADALYRAVVDEDLKY